MRYLMFIAQGEPAGKGSLRTFVSKHPAHNGRTIADHPPTVKRFQARVERAATEALTEAVEIDERWLDAIDGPVGLELEFRFPVPKVRARKADEHGVLWHAAEHDVDKLARTVFDGLERANVVTNDARVCKLTASKFECSPAVLATSFHGVMVRVVELPELPA